MKYLTDLHCDNCISKVAPHLDGDASIKKWEVEKQDQGMVLKLEGVDTSKAHVSSLLGIEGYHIIHPETVERFWFHAPSWKKASFNTLNCLIGCSIGDFGMVIFLQAYYPWTPLPIQMALAIVAGLMTSIALETTILKFREGFPISLAFRTAIGMSFLSMVAMEIAMTATDFAITGGMADFSNPVYWLALVPALIVGFLTPLPYNYYRLKKYDQACH